MSAAQPKSYRAQNRRRHHHPSRSRPLSTRPKSTKSTHDNGQDKDEEEEDEWFAIRNIIAEKVERGKTYYKVDWDGTDKNGQPHKPSWEPEQNLTLVAISEWKKTKAVPGKHTRNTPGVALDDTHQSTQDHDPRKCDSAQPPNWQHQGDSGKRLSEQAVVEGTAYSEHRVIPASQPVSVFSTSSQVQRELPTASHETSESHLFKSTSQSTTQIPSHQPDLYYISNSEGSSGSAFVVATDSDNPQSNSHSTAQSNSQATATGEFLTQQNFDLDFDLDIIPPTSPLNNSTNALPLHEQQHPSTDSGETASQAAQIVLPLSSHQEEFLTQSQPNFTVYDDDLAVPDTILKQQTQHSPQDASQALSELDVNTRNTSSSKDYELGSQSAASHTELLQSELNKSANSIDAEESPVGQLTSASSDYPNHRPSTPRQQAVPSTMDDVQSSRLSARDRLKLIRDQNFASLSDLSTPATNSTDADQVGAKVEGITVSHADAQEVQVVEAPLLLGADHLTSSPSTSAAFLTHPLDAAQSELTANDQQAQVPETTQAPAEQEEQGKLRLEESAPVEVGYVAQEEQLATLDPSALTLSIEHDMDVSPSIPTDDALPPGLQLPDEFPMSHDDNDDTFPASYPKSLLPYVPTGPGEYVVTLPFHNNHRPVYNDVLRDNEKLIREFNASFLVSPHQKPHPAIVAKLDEMFSRLFDICDLPPFMETIPSMKPDNVMKHLISTNAKFAFVDELLFCLAEAGSDKKILILARPGKALELLGRLVEVRGYRYIRSGQEVVGPSSAKHPLTAVISSTQESPSSIPGDVDAIVAFDHTYRQEVLPLTVRERSPLLMVLTNTCSIQHINMRVAENLEPLERKNILVLALVKAMRYVEDVDDSLITKLHKAAETFAKHIRIPDHDDFYWIPQEVPEDVFGDIHVASTLHGTATEQPPTSRKRSHETEGDETPAKRPRMSQPTIVTNMSRISDSLKSLIGDDSLSDTPRATLSVSVGKLETLSAKIASLEAQLEESKKREQQFRALSDRSKREVDDHTSTVNLLQAQYMVALGDRGTYEAQYKKEEKEAKFLRNEVDFLTGQADTFKERIDELEKDLQKARNDLLGSNDPDLAKMAQMEGSLKDCKVRFKQLEKKVTMAQSDMEYAKSAYQDASQRAGELQAENRVLEQRIQELSRKADDNIVKVNEIYAKSEVKELARMLDEQKSIVRERDTELGRLRDELKTLKEGRRGTRQNSVPRSPRLSAYGVNSPRNGGRPKGGSSSRGTSPAPPPTGMFDNGGNTPIPNSRYSHLRESRFQ
ncbi:hypothetical protein F4677DRAFT_418761 [Hypoxylon crocopeplum]|nr:hypothetical protein F4677DRAFT_418761 [Hypoxylon crocopeplum]